MITSADIKELAARAGFDLCGITTPEVIPEARDCFTRWLDKGFQAEMCYLERDVERRTDPSRLGIDAKSVIVLGLNYYQPDSESVPPGCGRVSKYARGRDYHKVIGGMIKKLLKLIQTRHPETAKNKFKWWNDYGPFLERAYAAKAGMGFMAKNALLINRQFGSWLLLGEIVTDLELEPDDPQAINHGRCGTCTICIDACPTGAIVADGVVQASKCISYLTIEKPSAVTSKLAPKLGDWVFGCDICQDVCPHNNPRRSIPTKHPDMRPERGVGEFLNLRIVLAMTTREQFLELTAGTPLTRPKLDGLQRIAEIIISNQNEH